VETTKGDVIKGTQSQQEVRLGRTDWLMIGPKGEMMGVEMFFYRMLDLLYRRKCGGIGDNFNNRNVPIGVSASPIYPDACQHFPIPESIIGIRNRVLNGITSRARTRATCRRLQKFHTRGER
jgi:hypothetical protein